MPLGHSFKRVGQLDPAPLLARLAARPDLWKAGPRETFEGSPHAQAASIIVRGVPTETVAFLGDEAALKAVEASMVNAILNSTDAVDYDAARELMPEIGNAVMQVLEPLGAIGELGHVMLTHLKPGTAIAPHTDEGVYADLFDRFHVCLAGGPGNVFRCGQETFSPAPGDIFWFNHKRRHSVQNLDSYAYPTGGLDRIHLIVDVMAPHFTALRGIYYQAEPEMDPAEAMGLLRAHYAEVAHYQDIPLDPDLDTYAKLHELGQLRRYTVRDAGKLVGYVLFFVRRNLHYRGSLQAWQDIFYIDPAYRKGMVPARLIRHAEERLKAEGVQVVYHHAKRTNQMGELVARLGYELVDEIYAKRLDKRS